MIFEGSKRARASYRKLHLSEPGHFLVEKRAKMGAKRGTVGLETRSGKYDAYMLGLGGAKKRTC